VQSVISISQLNKIYASGHPALQGIDLDIRQGEIFALLGPNGAGKTTLISIICGIVNPGEGRVLVAGHDIVRDYRAARSQIGLVPQELVSDVFETVWATVKFSRGLFGKKPDPAYLEQLLKDLSLWDKRDAKIMELSGGMKRRVMIAKALSHEPQILFLDEPTAGVDVELRQGLWQFVRRLNREGHTIVLTTHYLEEAQELCGRIGMLRAGRLIALEQTQVLLRRLAGLQVRLRLQGELPATLRPQVIEAQGSMVVLRLAQPAEVEQVLATCRAAGVAIEEIEVGHADLEDVFLQMMSDSRTSTADSPTAEVA
jgi:ABC-2 type transport system ATP-binding protein